MPNNWPKLIQLDGICIGLNHTKKNDIIRKFKLSVGNKYVNVHVVDVEEICNEQFYQQYQW